MSIKPYSFCTPSQAEANFARHSPEADIVALDGVYAPGRDVEPEFFPLRAPDDGEIAALAQTVALRITALLKRRGLDPGQSHPEDSDALTRDQPWLADLYAASVSNRIADGPNAGRRVAVGGDPIDPESLDTRASPRCASVAGFSLHANVSIPAPDRDRLERLCRYAARPPLATERLEQLTDGRLLYRFKRTWRNGATHAIFSPLELIERLAALVPTPRAHLTRYHGVLGPAARWRPLIVPAPAHVQEVTPAGPSQPGAISETADPAPAEAHPPAAAARRPRNYAWAELIRRVFYADVLSCNRCGGKLRLISAIHPPEATRKILDCLGLPSRPPPVAPAALDRQPTLIDEWL